ncbi:MAG: ABC transporter permease [Bryobacteraceae bacterium]
MRFALRLFIKSPGFTAAAVLALALGGGAGTVIFSAVYSVLLRPLPFRDPGQLVAVWEKSLPRQRDRNFVSPANYLEWSRRNHVFSGMAAIQNYQANLDGGDPEELQAERVTPNLFALLGAAPLLGRPFAPGDERARLVLLSHRLWRRRFGSDTKVVGKTLRLNDQPWTIAGVLKPEFHIVNREVDLWTPLALDNASLYRESNRRDCTVIARLKPGVTAEQAGLAMESLARELERAYPRLNAGWSVAVLPLAREITGEVRPALLMLFGAVLLLVLMACANVANLLLARAAARRREIAVRAALGAGRGRLARQLAGESILLGLAGGLAGLLLAFVGIRFLAALAPKEVPRLEGVGLNLPVLGFALGLSLATALLFGLAPALAAAGADVSAGLREGARGSSAGPLHGRLRNLLAVCEISLAVVLVAGAVLLGRSFLRLRAVDPGLDPSNLLTMRVLLSGPQAAGPARVAFFEQALERIRALPGVRAAGTVSFLPVTGFGSGATFWVEGQPPPATRPVALVRAADPGYFEAAGIPLRHGRGFTQLDRGDAPRVVVVSQSLARQIFPGQNPIGRRLSMDFRHPVSAEIVGVAGDVRAESVRAEPLATIYCPHRQLPSPAMAFAVRTAQDPETLARAVVAEIRALNPGQPVAALRTMDQILAESLAAHRFQTALLGAFAAVALLLAAVGVYAVVSYNVAEQTHEIGIRMALGASGGRVVSEVVRQAMTTAVAGILIGSGVALRLTRTLAALLYSIGPGDPVTFASVPLVLAGVAALASWIPARRAVRIDPLEALRQE